MTVYAGNTDSAEVTGVHPSTATTPLFNTKADYLWPTDASPYASSSFGETRAAHFHAALDIKTWGRKGYEVYATRDGKLARIGVYAVGYGNVVYLQHADSTYSVYAHLEKFAPRIRHVVDSLRLQNYSFELDHIVKDTSLYFQRGEVIGYSGATGVGPPHLHFELRTKNHKPFNPLLTNISIADRRPPRFEGLSVEPISPDALIEGKKQYYTKPPRYVNGTYDFGTIEVQGTVGLGVNVFDLANRVNNAYSVYKLKLTLNDKVLFHSRVDSFSYNETRQLFLDRVYPILQSTRQGYQRLFIADGNTLPFYKRDLQRDGRLRLSPGQHTFTIIASDYYGNQRKAQVTLDVRPSQANPLPAPNSVDDDRSSKSFRQTFPKSILNNWFWHENWIAIPDTKKNPARLTSITRSRREMTNRSVLKVGAYQVILTTQEKIIKRRNHPEGILLNRIYPNRTDRIFSNDQRASALFPTGSLYDTLSIAITSTPGNRSSLAQINLYPGDKPLQNSYRLYYKTDSLPDNIPAQKWAFYRKHPRKKEPVYIPTTFTDSTFFSTEVEHLGSFIMLSDTTRPTISNPQLYQNKSGTWHMSVSVQDELSGVAYKNAQMYVNGRRGIPEYDPEGKKLIYYHPDFKPQGSSKLKVILPDKVGNERIKIFSL